MSRVVGQSRQTSLAYFRGFAWRFMGLCPAGVIAFSPAECFLVWPKKSSIIESRKDVRENVLGHVIEETTPRAAHDLAEINQ